MIKERQQAQLAEEAPELFDGSEDIEIPTQATTVENQKKVEAKAAEKPKEKEAKGSGKGKGKSRCRT